MGRGNEDVGMVALLAFVLGGITGAGMALLLALLLLIRLQQLRTMRGRSRLLLALMATCYKQTVQEILYLFRLLILRITLSLKLM